jgi:hypothetical protein
MGEDTFYNRYGIEKHKLLFNRSKWRSGAYDNESINNDRAEDLLSASE